MITMVIMIILFMTAACPSVSGSHRFCKPTGKCMFSDQICDSLQDCPDDTDEVNCSQYFSVLLICLDDFDKIELSYTGTPLQH